MEKTLVFIKPDGVERGLVGTVLNRFEQRGIKVERLELKQLTETEVDAHYQEHLERDFYPNLKRYIMSGPIVVMVLAADNVIAIVRKMVGVTNSAEAEPGTIRGDYALTTQNNIIHASDSVESAEREIANFFNY
ncbi:MAG: nucleoside-diphosphate kinase [Actinobacteria bacterium]|nr:nucleoside-diphosphate kinase [Actinomycetota bacterium]|tara:strand:+ start:3691 stop:4092 length:402 start_codon:yes stop_codon:yes gene_type:complete